MPLNEVLNEIREDRKSIEKSISDLINAFEQKHLGLNVTGIEINYDGDSKGEFLTNIVVINFEIVVD